MNPNQTFNLSSVFPVQHSALFLRIITLLIIVYVVILVINFFRDKFINSEPDNRHADISGLLILLNKLFQISGIGFLVIALLQFLFGIDHHNFGDAQNSVVFAVLLIFLGIAFKSALKSLKKM